MICRELLAARLERKSFFAWTSFLLNRNLLQKRLGVEGGIAAPNNLTYIICDIASKKLF